MCIYIYICISGPPSLWSSLLFSAPSVSYLCCLLFVLAGHRLVAARLFARTFRMTLNGLLVPAGCAHGVIYQICMYIYISIYIYIFNYYYMNSNNCLSMNKQINK